ncbi:hypothetical protein ACHAWX_000581 [Stephanocyclus meneghinianus]
MIGSFLVSLATPFQTGPIHATAPPFLPYVGTASQSNINDAIRPRQTVQAHELAALTWLSSSFEPSRQNSWNLRNGNVSFETPLVFSGIALEKHWESNPGGGGGDSFVSLSNPIFLGSGGSGAVFSFAVDSSSSSSPSSRIETDPQQRVAIKVSWKSSRTSVQNECTVLQAMERYHVPHVERCLGAQAYPYEDGRIMIALQPALASPSGITSSISNVPPDRQEKAVKQVMETMAAMLHANIITVDVQTLISEETGEVLFIDFTEAMTLSLPATSKDIVAVVGFCNEIKALVPDSLQDMATHYLKVLLQGMDGNGMTLSSDVYSVLESVWLE